MSSQAAVELAAIFMSERGRLRRLIERIVGDRTISEDLVHETFLKVSNAMARTAVVDHRGYLVRTATNVALDYRRRLAAARPAANSDAEFSTLTDRDATPEAELATRQALMAVLATLDRVPPRTRRAFELHRFEERTMTEIAAELSISTSLVHKLVTDAYTAIRSALRNGGFLPPGPENTSL